MQATNYTVYDWYGNTVTSGSLTPPTSQLLTIPAPGGGWNLGWYRIFFDGPINDATWGTSYAATMFSFVRSSTRFQAMPSSQTYLAGGSGQTNDFVRKGSLGYGTSRINIDNANSPTTGTQTLAKAVSDVQNYAVPYWTDPGVQYLDPARTRYLWLAFPNQTVDQVFLHYSTNSSWGNAFCKDGTVDGSKVFIQVGAGTSSGSKILIYYPDSLTLAETYDNLASVSAAKTAINGVSSYIIIHGQPGISTQVLTGPSTPTAIGNAFFNGVAQVVSTMYPLGVTYFEGPSNEPNLSFTGYAQAMKIFQASVKAGNPSAKAIGPTPVDVRSLTSGWKTFLDGGGGNYCDEIATHAYNSASGGDVNLCRQSFREWTQFLNKYGFNKLWQTESTWSQPENFGLFQVRNSKWEYISKLMMEQYGIVREKNNHWYDVSHGFYSVPAWWQNGFFGEINPEAILGRVLVDETWGMVHQSGITFGEWADNIFLGSIYENQSTGDQCVVVAAGSYMPTCTVTFSLSGAVPATLTYSDPWGNLSTLTVTVDNKVTMAVQDIPCYLRVPSGVTVTVDHVNDWPSQTMTNLAGLATTYTMNGGATSAPELCDGLFLYDYPSFTGTPHVGGGMRTSAAICSTAAPDQATLLFPSTISIDRVIIWAGNVWQKASTLIDFDVQTTADGGATWTTRQTINRSSDADGKTYVHGSPGVACQTETWYDGQSIFDVNLGGAVSCNGVRLNVRRTTYGAAPNATAMNACVFYGSADTDQHVVLQEIAVISSDHTPRTPKLRTFNGTTDKVIFGGRSEHLSSSNNTLTAAAWIKVPSITSSRKVIMAAGAPGWDLGINATTGALSFTSSVTSSIVVTANTWQYVGASMNMGAGHVTFFRMLEDGTYTTDVKSISTTPSYGIPTIGANQAGNGSFWSGQIYQAAIWPDQDMSASILKSAGLTGAISIGPKPLFYAPINGESVEHDQTIFQSAGVVTGTTTASSGFPNVATTSGYIVREDGTSKLLLEDGSGALLLEQVAPAPINTVAPVVSGVTHVGSTLTTTNGTWTDDGTPNFTYQWQRDLHGAGSFTTIPSEISSTYVLVDADDGCNIRSVVTDNTPDGNTAANSNSVGTVTEPAPTNVTAPMVSGGPSIGATLSATTGTWANMSGYNPTFTYQWTRDGVNIASATDSTYVAQSADSGHAVGCTVTATNTGGTASHASSNSITVTSKLSQFIGIPILG